MRRVQLLFFPAILLCLLQISAAQNWAGILSPSRAINWNGVGASIVNRTTRCGSVIAAYSGNANTINNAISACPAGQYVELGAGTFTLSTGIELDTDNVTLRGQGADQTKLRITGNTGSGCHIGDGRRVNICKGGGGNIGIDSADNTATWSAGYAQGTTTITLSGHNNMVVGTTLWLDQRDDASDGFPVAGDVWVKNWGAGDSYERAGRGYTEGHIVTAINGNNITITPPVMMPTFRSANSPGAWWGNGGSVLQNAGLEGVTIDYTGGNGVYMVNCTGCWVKGVRTIYSGTVSSQWRGIMFVNAMNVSVVDNYFYGAQATGLVSMYGIAPHITSHSLFQNNIIHASVNPFVINSPTYGSVFAYNVFDNQGVSASVSQSSFILHGHASMNLFEGNNERNFSGDNIHTSHFFNTLFRNHLDGRSRNPSGTETQAAFAFYAAQRFFNVVGNVIGASNWSTYQNSQSPPAFCQSCIHEHGWEGTNSNARAETGNDTNVRRTVMRWGNWDNITSTNDNGTNDATGTRFVASEVPSGIADFPNPVPANNNLPASFYLNAKPTWFGSVVWPPIGPDVANGNAPNDSTAPTGGHANRIPARVCFESSANDPAYSSSSPRIKLFNADACYGGSAGPDAPDGLVAVPK